MFTGIVEESGRVQSIKPDDSAIHLVVRSDVCARGLKVGGSLAVVYGRFMARPADRRAVGR